MNQPLVVARCRIKGITLEVCHGDIPDVFRLLWFGQTTELKLPDTKTKDDDFNNWLKLYRNSKHSETQSLLDISQCS